MAAVACCSPQTETPEQLKARNAARKPGAKAATVVERQAVTVLSRGTLLDPEMVSTHPDAAYVLAGAARCTDSIDHTNRQAHTFAFVCVCTDHVCRTLVRC